MYCFRSVGREPGRLASSINSWSESSLLSVRRWVVVGERFISSCSVELVGGRDVVSGSVEKFMPKFEACG